MLISSRTGEFEMVDSRYCTPADDATVCCWFYDTLPDWNSWHVCFRYLDDMTSERVDAQGVTNIACSLQNVFKDKVCAAVLPISTDITASIVMVSGKGRLEACCGTLMRQCLLTAASAMCSHARSQRRMRNVLSNCWRAIFMYAHQRGLQLHDISTLRRRSWQGRRRHCCRWSTRRIWPSGSGWMM